MAEQFLHLAAQAVGQLEGLVANPREHLAGGLFRQRFQTMFANLGRQVAPALGRLREKFFGRFGVVAQFLLKLVERIGHLFFRPGQVLQRQLVFPAQLPRTVVSLRLLGQILLRPVERLEQIEILDQLLHLAHVIQRLDDLFVGLLLHAAQPRDLIVRRFLQIIQHVRRQLARAARRRTALRNVARGGGIVVRALPDVLRLLAQHFLEVLLDIIKRMLPDKIFHAPGLPVEFFVQLILPGEEAVQLLGERLTLPGVGLGKLPGQFLRFVAELFLLVNQVMQIVVELGIFGFRVGNVGLFAQVIVVILDADDLEPDGLAPCQMRLRRGVHRLGKQGNHIAGLDAKVGEIEIRGLAAGEDDRVIPENLRRGKNAVQAAMQPDFAQAVIVAGLNLRLQFEIHGGEGVVVGIGDMNLRRQIVRDRERALAISLRRQPGDIHDAEAQPAGLGRDERAAHFVVRRFLQHDALRRLVAGGDFQQAFPQRAVGL